MIQFVSTKSDKVMTERMYLISESELDYIEKDLFNEHMEKISDDVRARGPIESPSPTDICMDCYREPAACENDPSKCQHDPIDISAFASQAREEAFDKYLERYLEMDKVGICIHPDNEPPECDSSYCGICVALAVRESLRAEAKK